MPNMIWSAEKNELLKQHPDRAICFEDIVSAIESGGLLDDIENVNDKRNAHQRQYVVLYNDYVYCVPYVVDGDNVFLKTVYPSRKLTRKYLSGAQDG